MSISFRAWALIVTLMTLGSVRPGDGSDGIEVAFLSGRVTLTAHDVTLRAILKEWTIVGNTQFIDVDEFVRVPVRLQLINVPEAQALRILLRDAAGFIAAPRATAPANGSMFARVVIMPSSHDVSSVSASALPSTAMVHGAASVQGASMRIIPKMNVNLADSVGGVNLDELREILPQPLRPSPSRSAASPSDHEDSRPVVAPKPGMPVTATEDLSPVFIRRPVRP